MGSRTVPAGLAPEPQPATSERPVRDCPNCGAAGELPYCGMCGQERDIQPPTLRAWLGEFLDDVFNLNGRLPRTLGVLLRSPGGLTQEWLDGRRARYVAPLRLYIICSVAMFAAGIILRFIGLQFGVGYRPGGAIADEAVAETARRSATHALVVLLPLFAVWLKLLFRSSGRYYVEHLVFTLHAHAFTFIAVIGMYLLVFAPESVAQWVRPLFPLSALVYLILGLRRVYGESIPRTLVKGVLLFLIQAAAVLALTLSLIEMRAPGSGRLVEEVAPSRVGSLLRLG